MLWEAWQKEGHPPQAPATSEKTVPTPASAPAPSVTPNVTPREVGSIPTASVEAPSIKRERVRVTTGEMIAEIDTLGGDLVYLEFLEHKDINDKSKNFVLLTPDYRYSVQSGLIGADLPNHKTLYSASAKVMALAPGQDRLDVRLEAPPVNGVKVVKVLTFHRNSHVIDISHEIMNGSTVPFATHAYFQITRDGQAPPSNTKMMSTYTGAAIYTEQDKYVKVAFSDIDKGKTAYSKDRGQRLDRHGAALFRDCAIAAGQATTRVLHQEAGGEFLFRRRDPADRGDCAGRDRQSDGSAVCRAAGAG